MWRWPGSAAISHTNPNQHARKQHRERHIIVIHTQIFNESIRSNLRGMSTSTYDVCSFQPNEANRERRKVALEKKKFLSEGDS